MKNRQIAFTAPDEMLDKVSREAEQKGINRSQALRMILRAHYSRNDMNTPEGLAMLVQAQGDVANLRAGMDEGEIKELQERIQKGLSSVAHLMFGGEDHADNRGF